MVKVVIDDAVGVLQSHGNGAVMKAGATLKAGVSGSSAGSRTGDVLTHHQVGREGTHDQAYGRTQADPFSESATKLYPLGSKLVYGNRTFRYARAAASTIAIGEIVQAAIPVANNNDVAVEANQSAASTALTLVLGGAPTVNQFEDGYVVVVDGDGQGQMCAVASNDDASNPCALVLTEPLVTAVTLATSVASIFVNQYADLVKSVAGASSACLGVAPIGITASYYFWLQTAGPAAVVQATSNRPVAASLVVASNGVAGAAEVFDSGTDAETVKIGLCLSSTGAAADHCVVMLNLE